MNRDREDMFKFREYSEEGKGSLKTNLGHIPDEGGGDGDVGDGGAGSPDKDVQPRKGKLDGSAEEMRGKEGEKCLWCGQFGVHTKKSCERGRVSE